MGDDRATSQPPQNIFAQAVAQVLTLPSVRKALDEVVAQLVTAGGHTSVALARAWGQGASASDTLPPSPIPARPAVVRASSGAVIYDWEGHVISDYELSRFVVIEPPAGLAFVWDGNFYLYLHALVKASAHKPATKDTFNALHGRTSGRDVFDRVRSDIRTQEPRLLGSEPTDAKGFYLPGLRKRDVAT